MSAPFCVSTRFAVATLSLVALGGSLFPSGANAARTLPEYRYFRALTIDLVGRIPTRAEITAFEAPSFDLGAWVDDKLRGAGFAERLRHIYMDLLRLEIGPAFQFVQNLTILRRHQILGPDGQPMLVYYRQGQRRTRPDTDGELCLTQAETGLQFPRNTAPTGTAQPISQTALDASTVEIKPWWLYRDYRAADPRDRYGDAWSARSPGFIPVPALLSERDGGVSTQSIRVCKEEAQAAATGTVFVTGRTTNPPAGTPPPYGRLTQLPLDSAFARMNPGQPISCTTGLALANSASCGCGPGLERCMPGDSFANDPRAFTLPSRLPLGWDLPVDSSPQAQSSWHRLWWAQEAQRFLEDLFLSDRDFREVLTGRHTFVNGPLVHFYKSVAGATCCGNGFYFGYSDAEPLARGSNMPELAPHDTAEWRRVDDRGPHAAGLLTMPIFLTKYGTRRARAHVLYNAFMCREFIAANVALTPSTEPNLTIRPGCATCHATLEPLASYFSRVMESDWTYLPPAKFPAVSPLCRLNAQGAAAGYCRAYYDPAFSNGDGGMMRGAYGSLANADEGPAGLATRVVQDPGFAPCVARNVASSFLGRALNADDKPLEDKLAQVLIDGAFKMRALVRELVLSDAYKRSNNLTSSAWRAGGAP
jgi:hypothetical protein